MVQEHRLTRIVLLTCVALFAASVAAGAEPPSKPARHADYHWQPLASANALKNPLAKDPAAAKGGARLFRNNCAQCHGEKGAGQNSAPDLRAFEVQVQSDGALFWRITNGNLDRGMPSFAGLPQLERWQLVLYLRQLGK